MNYSTAIDILLERIGHRAPGKRLLECEGSSGLTKTYYKKRVIHAGITKKKVIRAGITSQSFSRYCSHCCGKTPILAA
jgi:hypothetical protein